MPYFENIEVWQDTEVRPASNQELRRCLGKSRSCPSTKIEVHVIDKTVSAQLERRATRFLARHAKTSGALSGMDLEFICENPERAEEVSEFMNWLEGQHP